MFLSRCSADRPPACPLVGSPHSNESNKISLPCQTLIRLDVFVILCDLISKFSQSLETFSPLCAYIYKQPDLTDSGNLFCLGYPNERATWLAKLGVR